MQDFRKLKVWEKAHNLTLDIYRATRCFPREEVYGLSNQMRRAAVSIGCNIAEGACRGSDADFGRFLQMALGSAGEIEYQVLLARDLELLRELDSACLFEEVAEVKRMLASLLQKLRADS